MSAIPIDASRKFLFLLTSARADGNAEQLAREASLTLPAEVEQRAVGRFLLTLHIAGRRFRHIARGPHRRLAK